ncbi:DUF6597 domain-containing transcriptional factor [Chitinophaga sp. 30R24]|uniref:DUF6597 domain-containing transcriptional factor n=1 Tax=Chitinophaga sp. 30R24 TaxID=3248838 RepID=UPI003B90B83D
MRYTELLPHPVLSDYIDTYWTLTHDYGAMKTQHILPDGCIDIIFNLGADCTTDHGQFLIKSEKVYLVGTMTTFNSATVAAGTNLLGIRFKPAAFQNFYQYCSLHEITDQTLELDKAFCPNLYQTAKKSTAYLNHFFAGELSPRKDNITHLVADLQTHQGRISVRDLAKKHFMSERQLERRFKQQIGIHPKTFISIVRNQAALNAIKHRDVNSSLLEIALHYGYYDHAHLSKEIKKFTGQPPSLV